MWPLQDFTEANGATRLVPGSHRWVDEQPGPETAFVTAEIPAGSALFYFGSLWHGGGANSTDTPRLGVVLHYAASWLRPVENHVLAVPPDAARHLPCPTAGHDKDCVRGRGGRHLCGRRRSRDGRAPRLRSA